MVQVLKHTFGVFQENTYILYNEEREAIIIDPGCSEGYETQLLQSDIVRLGLTPILLLNTHCHIDHILGNRWVTDTYKIPFQCHKEDLYNLRAAEVFAPQYGLRPPNSPLPNSYLNEGDTIQFGGTNIEILFTPGHCLGHISFYIPAQNMLFSGDVLFHRSIGRTDLPGGNFGTLQDTMLKKIYTLPNQTVVYSGHGIETTIGEEKQFNPFIHV